MDELESIIGDQLNNVLMQLVQGVKEDIQNFSRAITNDLYATMMEPDAAKREQMQAALKNQIAMIAEVNRIRGSKTTWNTVGVITDALFEVGFRALGIPPVPAQDEG